MSSDSYSLNQFQIVAFDADDTLWHNETLFNLTHDRFKKLLNGYLTEENVDLKLYETEIKNLHLFGYGIKGFTLSMIETAIEVSNGQVTADQIQSILNFGKSMIGSPIELLPGVAETLKTVRKHVPIMVITKGDLFDQESKLARSGLADIFDFVEIVSEKNKETYDRILKKHVIDPHRFLMIGNSVASDILPVLESGGKAIHIPYHITWQHEVPKTESQAQFPVLKSMTELLPFINR